jgi:hypothetical protein
MKHSLGPLPEAADIRLSINISKSLKALLDLYCAQFGEVWGEPAPAAATLIPHMLEEFMRKDRRFKHILREQRQALKQREKSPAS